jgi:hypothetical protein
MQQVNAGYREFGMRGNLRGQKLAFSRTFLAQSLPKNAKTGVPGNHASISPVGRMLPRGFGNNRQNNALHIVSLISDDDELSSQRKNSKGQSNRKQINPCGDIL